MRIHRYPQQRRRLRPFRILLSILLLFGISAVGWSFFGSGKGGNPGGAAAHSLPIKSVTLPQNILDRVTPLPHEQEYPRGVLTEKQRFDRLVIKKSERRLYAYTHDKVVRVYGVALGSQPLGPKEEEGDGKTPEGIYAIKEKKEKTAYHKNLIISYPNAANLAKAAETGKNPGGNISIHGLGKEFGFLGIEHRASDWTYGCVAVSNEEIDELFKHTPAGTPVEILP